MQKNPRLWHNIKHRGHAAGVVVMAVAQHNGFHAIQWQPQGFRVDHNQVGLAGVKKQAVFTGLNVEGKSVFCDQTQPMDTVLNENRDANGFTHVVS